VSGDRPTDSPTAPAAADPPAIEVRDLGVAYGGTEVLSGVSLTVERGRFVGLVGPNGAGKTTLLRCLNGALDPDAGTVRVGGDDVSRLSSREASRRVATVPQRTAVTFEFPVRDVVAMGRTPHLSRFGTAGEADRAAVDEAMARTAVAEFADRPVTEVSGGERQRVLLARALAQDAPVLVLDEPTASLDINHQVRTLELVRELTADGRTAVAAIHDLNLAARFCDELVVVSGGGVLATGSPGDVLTESTVEDAFDTDAAVARHPVTGATTVTALRPHEDDSGRVHVVGGGGSAARYLHALSRRGFDVSVGALNEGDTDAAVAAELGLDVVTVPPYGPVGEDDAARVRECVAAADAVLVADVAVGRGNLPNLAAAADASPGTSLVVVEGRPFEARNYAGDAGRRTYRRLTERGRVVGPDGATRAVAAAVATSPADDSVEPRL
jgi:iron complex transport system ATP-binding protein